MNPEIAKTFGNRTRVRVCGLCWIDGKLLLVNHKSLRSGDFWAPPGGGVEFGQHADIALERELAEETGITGKVEKLLFVCEFIQHPLHAIELFFEVNYMSGAVKTGFDPELSKNQQIISDVRLFSPAEIRAMPATSLHGIFEHCRNPTALKKLTGFIKI